MKIFYTHRATNQLKKLPRLIQERIAEKMRFYSEQEDPLRFARRLVDKGEGEFRFRIGNYRVAFDIKKGDIYVVKIKKRDKAY